MRVVANHVHIYYQGSVFVEFSTPQEAEAVVQKKLQFEGQDLLLKMKYVFVGQVQSNTMELT